MCLTPHSPKSVMWLLAMLHTSMDEPVSMFTYSGRPRMMNCLSSRTR